VAYLSGKYKGQDTPLFRAIRRYGKESFKIELLCSCQSKEELDLMEDLYIAAYDSMNKSKGYNLKRGGANGKPSEEVRESGGLPKGFKHSLESRKKMSEAIKKSLLINPRPPVSEITRKKIGEAQKNRPSLSEETRQKLRERFSGDKSTSFNQEVKTEDLIKLYLEGKSCPQISKLFPLTEAGVRHRLKKAGIKMRPSITDQYQ
jgi:group I intron endonuclease